MRRRPKINATGLRASRGTQLGSAPVSGHNPFAAVIEACAQAAQAYSPDNALRVIDWYEGMPGLVDAISAMLTTQGARNTEEFFLYPAAGEFAARLGAQFQAYKGPCEDARATFERAHIEDLEKLRNPKAHQEKWDLSANRERP
jgi:hypothetical protein